MGHFLRGNAFAITILLSATATLAESPPKALIRKSAVQSSDGDQRNVVAIGETVALSARIVPTAPLDERSQGWSLLDSLKQTKVDVKLKLAINPQAGLSRALALKTVVKVRSPDLIAVNNETTIQRPGRDFNCVHVDTDVQWHRAANKDLTSLLLEKPEYVVCGANRPGPTVWFVNGILTSKSQATAIGEQISRRLNRRVHVLHNPTVIESPYETGLEAMVLKDDFSEAAYDRIWPAVIAGQLMADSLASDAIDIGDRLQRNPVTRQLAWVLYHSEEPVSLVTHSQGCLIARNALFMMSLLGREQKARDNVAWVAAGIPLHDCEICQCPNRMTVLDCRADPVPRFLGLRGGGFDCDPAHHDFVRNYLDQLTSDQVFPVDESAK